MEAVERLHRNWEAPSGWFGWFATVDHKKIGARYLVTATAFLLLGGIEALIMRLQLARPDQSLLGPEQYDQLFSLHGMTMIFWYASPILSGYGNYFLPLVLGSRDMAFPRLNAFSYWTFLLSGLFLYGGLLAGQAPHAGWFAYTPYTESRYSPGLHMDFYALALLFLTISTTVGAVNFIVTILKLRAPGMTLNKMPLLSYSTLTTSVVVVLSLPALTAALVFLELDRRWHTHFFHVAGGGSPILWQHLFWFFGHPWVYIIFLPATGMISMLLPVFARRPIVGYPWVASATVLTGLVGFGVWVHHMFATGMSMMGMSFFSAASMTISLFTAVQVFAWIATIVQGRPVLTTSMLFALGFIVSIVIGGLSGIVTAVIAFDWQVTDTYFVVAHIHYVLVGANVFPVIAALYYWYPKMTGRLLDESIGRWSFWTTFTGFHLAFFPMHIAGLAGMPRRIYTYPSGTGWTGVNTLETIGAFIFAIGAILTVWNVWRSRTRGEVAGDNPWNADTLEWAIPSPPPEYAFERLPLVRTRHPLWDDFDEFEDHDDERVLPGPGHLTLVTSWLDARPLAVAKMPEDTLTPLITALVLTAVFVCVLGMAMWVAVAALVVTGILTGYWLWPRAPREEPA